MSVRRERVRRERDLQEPEEQTRHGPSLTFDFQAPHTGGRGEVLIKGLLLRAARKIASSQRRHAERDGAGLQFTTLERGKVVIAINRPDESA